MGWSNNVLLSAATYVVFKGGIDATMIAHVDMVSDHTGIHDAFVEREAFSRKTRRWKLHESTESSDRVEHDCLFRSMQGPHVRFFLRAIILNFHRANEEVLLVPL